MCWRLIVSLRGINYLVVEPKAKQRWRDAEGVMTEWVYGYTTYELDGCWLWLMELDWYELLSC